LPVGDGANLTTGAAVGWGVVTDMANLLY